MLLHADQEGLAPGDQGWWDYATALLSPRGDQSWRPGKPGPGTDPTG